MKQTAPHANECLSFISSQLGTENKPGLPPVKFRPGITISRQVGSGAMVIANELATYLQNHSPAPCHWSVFDRNLVEKVLEDHKLPKEIAKFMPEDHVSAIQDAVEEMLGLHHSSRTLWQQTAETILRLAEFGHVILVGRGSNAITAHMKNIFHVRLIAPLELRVQRIMARQNLDEKAALEYVEHHDRGRQRYVRDHFHRAIDDSLLYDLVINTARLPNKMVARIIGDTVLQWAETL